MCGGNTDTKVSAYYENILPHADLRKSFSFSDDLVKKKFWENH